jgi:hypothetical protein
MRSQEENLDKISQNLLMKFIFEKVLFVYNDDHACMDHRMNPYREIGFCR